jgi:hypothetical protein
MVRNPKVGVGASVELKLMGEGGAMVKVCSDTMLLSPS